jgi:hypothetical protein
LAFDVKTGCAVGGVAPIPYTPLLDVIEFPLLSAIVPKLNISVPVPTTALALAKSPLAMRCDCAIFVTLIACEPIAAPAVAVAVIELVLELLAAGVRYWLVSSSA